jgi:ankyrin repeat protein
LIDLYPLALDKEDETGYYPIHIAILSHDSDDLVRFLVEVDPLSLQRKGANCGASALHLACYKKRTSVIEYMIQNKDVQVNIRDYEGQTPLHWASSWSSGSDQIVKMLLQHCDTDINIHDNSNKIFCKKHLRLGLDILDICLDSITCCSCHLGQAF